MGVLRPLCYKNLGLKEMTEYLLVFYLISADYTDMRPRYAMGPMSKDSCINLSIKTPELARIYEVNDTIYLCTKIKDFKKHYPQIKYNVEYL
jgi:hypothetical protein